MYPKTISLYNDSSDPKTFKAYEGSEHAQHIFNGEFRDDLADLIVDFVLGGPE